MSEIDKLEKLVADLYEAKNPNRDDWADWIYPNHVLAVADYADQLAVRFGESVDQSRAVALLHDIADVKMARKSPNHEEESLRIAEGLLNEAGFGQDDIRWMVDDALRLHSCRDGNVPKSQVGKILASADGLAHINTEFYEFIRSKTLDRPNNWFGNWIKEKMPRDFEVKICFDDVREETRERYEELERKYGGLD